ncbi:cysteine proteinase [Piromyces finnis]|uniref:Ubiquitin carboxyl-terminal hydrolase n=1 Tax=Piromyces finnis TaxID=1754191 RepID=A0A1Y1V190_9FUNG|nr:cysteine proteinase [Piromyces finnis]|eukprot:ORX45038.1 cysteine proteinase [Piromyces finnis]
MKTAPANNSFNKSKVDAALTKNGNNLFILQQRRVHFKLSTRPDRQQELLKKKYSPINNPDAIGFKNDKQKVAKTQAQVEDEAQENEFQKPTSVLYRKDKLNLHWNKITSIGAGLRNLGNTCFLNSVLQCLTYTPPLTNILLASEHGRKCKTQQFCMMCEMENHVAMALGSGKSSVVPRSIASRIKNIAKHMRIGRQEDAHEFLRFVIEGLQNSVLRGYEKLDNRIKETNMIYQIFGGYLQSQVKCLECKYNSNTYDPCLDLSLDFKGCDSVKRALELFVKPELLSKGNKYKCERCKKLTNAQKQITIYQAPMVLTIQLKRFDFARSFYGGGKIGKFVSFDEVLNLSPYMTKSQQETPIYHLYAVLVHSGSSCNSGHYYCFVKNSNGIWYEMNDSSVSQVSLKTVLRQQAYLLFYVRDPSSIKKHSKVNTCFTVIEYSKYRGGGVFFIYI